MDTDPRDNVGDSYNNALAESVIGAYKTELIERRGPWRHVEAEEFRTLEWIDWFNTRRLLEPIGTSFAHVSSQIVPAFTTSGPMSLA